MSLFQYVLGPLVQTDKELNKTKQNKVLLSLLHILDVLKSTTRSIFRCTLHWDINDYC